MIKLIQSSTKNTEGLCYMYNRIIMIYEFMIES